MQLALLMTNATAIGAARGCLPAWKKRGQCRNLHRPKQNLDHVCVHVVLKLSQARANGAAKRLRALSA